MKINKIYIENFKKFEKLSVDEFDSQFNIVIGNNGFGKTSLLEAMCIGLGGYVACFNDQKTNHFTNYDIRRSVEGLGDASSNYLYHTPVSVTLDVDVKNTNVVYTRRKVSEKSTRTTIEEPIRKLNPIVEGMIQDDFSILPVLIYQGVSRMDSQKKRLKKHEFDKRVYTRSTGYFDCFSATLNVEIIRNWIEKMEMISWCEGKEIGEYESLKLAVSTFMNNLCGHQDGHIVFDRKMNEIVYVHDLESLPLDAYSAGYKSLLWSVLDIAFRMSILNPNLKKDAYLKTPGIVMIDELDLHLHPKWQWVVIDALKQTFPKVQFIVTTHSPILISSSKNDKLIIFDKEEGVLYKRSAYGYEIGDVLSSVQNTSKQVEDLKEQLNEFSKLLDNAEIAKAKKILDHLICELGETHPEIAKAKVSLEFEELMMEDD